MVCGFRIEFVNASSSVSSRRPRGSGIPDPTPRSYTAHAAPCAAAFDSSSRRATSFNTPSNPFFPVAAFMLNRSTLLCSSLAPTELRIRLMLLDSGAPVPLDFRYGGWPCGGAEMCARCVKVVAEKGVSSCGV